MQTIQEAQAFDIIPLPSLRPVPMQSDTRRLADNERQASSGSQASAVRAEQGSRDLSAEARQEQSFGAQIELREGEEQPPLLSLPADTGQPGHTGLLAVVLQQSSSQGPTAEQASGEAHAQPATSRPQPHRDDRDTEHWQGGFSTISLPPAAESHGQQALLQEEGAASREQDPFASTFPTSLISPTMVELEPDEWDTFQAPEEEAPQPPTPPGAELGDKGELKQASICPMSSVAGAA